MPEFDVILCHNSIDKPAIKKIGRQLWQRGIRPWLDEWEIAPGCRWQRVLQKQIEEIKSAAVFVGNSGIGPWQNQEIEILLCEFVNRGRRVIPIILPDAQNLPDLPLLLFGPNHWIDFRKQEPDPLEQLIWGITDTPPQRKMAIPIKGEIAAGGLVASITGYQKTVLVDELLIEPTCYGLRVTGDSMIDADIKDGDIVIIEPIQDADKLRDGEIVAAWIEGDGNLLKQFWKGNPAIFKSFNSTHEDIKVHFGEKEVRVEGVLVKVYRDGELLAL